MADQPPPPSPCGSGGCCCNVGVDDYIADPKNPRICPIKLAVVQLGIIEVNLFNNGVIETVDINRFNAPKSIDKVNSNAF